MTYMRFICVILGFILLASCSSEEGTKVEKMRAVNTTISEVQKGNFVYRLITEKAEYNIDEGVKIYAELVYVGDQASIDIYHAASPFYFPIYELTRDFEIGYNMDTPGLSSTLERGKPLIEEYSSSGGFDEHDTDEYVKFIKEVWANGFPEGYYIVEGYADFSLDPNRKQEDYNLKTLIDFEVRD